ncbi:glycosyltransferase family A protein [uncultured Lacinutrix sp.]|uniref:glycosyltransferase family A protein n=1 Tax=uncultured Lacinutrix sp. TaxID=574032 RepID=UPI00261807D6|nr:glycosyltransferase family A protein [uncultured Lacinutrix sp.]
MREGENISKEKKIEISTCSHRVIFPLYIPSQEGYYKDAFRIFEMSILSIIKTSISTLKISVISNGSCDSVNNKLMEMCNNNVIDQLIIEKESIGKLNSILKALRTVEERLITITDADVLFLNNWEKEVISIFEAFPNAGMVSAVPVFRTHYRHTANIWLKFLFSKKLKFRKVYNPEALTKFAKSIGWPRLDAKFKDVILTLKAKNNTIAVVGNSHFTGTYKKEVFKMLPNASSSYKLGGDSEKLYLDIPVIKMGGYRLATYNNYAYHIGNTIESWMLDEYNALKEEIKVQNSFNNLKTLKSKKAEYFLTEKIFKKALIFKPFKKWVFKRKGIVGEQINTFLK